VLVGMFFVLLLLGGGGGGAYYYYVVLGNQPPAFLEGILPAKSPSATPAPPVDTTTKAAAAPDSARSDSARRQFGAAELPNTGTLTLEGLPTRGAKVTVDGEPKQGPKLTLDAGSRRVEVTAPGYESFRATVAIRRGGDTVVTVSMRRPTAALRGAEQPEDVCTNPGPNYNRNDACFDAPPRAQVAPLVPLDARIQGTPTAVLMWVKVSEEGRALTFQIITHSNDPLFDRSAAGFALQITYNPAQKGGQPVEGWTRMLLRPMDR
jgi:hypothetical protein